MMTGKTTLIALFGDPLGTVKAPMIYNPWFEQQGIDAMVVPMGAKAEDYALTLRQVFRLSNLGGALVTMPHKISTLSLVDTVSTTARIAGACNAVRKLADGRLEGDMFDGTGFVRGVQRKGRSMCGARVLVAGAGGVGSAIAVSIAAAGAAELALFDANTASTRALASRLREHYPSLLVRTGSNDPAGFDMVVNATPLGMQDGDPLPFDPARLQPGTFVGEVVMKSEYTPLLRAAQARGCMVQIGSDMLFEQIPAYLEFFGFGSTTAEALRAVARIQY